MADSIMDYVVEYGGDAKKGKKVRLWHGGEEGTILVVEAQEKSSHSFPWGKAILLALVVVLAVVAIFCVCKDVNEDLEAARWILHTKEGCPACERQLEVLGGSYGLLVVCDQQNNVSSNYTDNPPYKCAEIEAFPFWYNEKSGETKIGLQSKSELRAMANTGF